MFELLAKVLADAYGITLSRRRPTGVIPLKTLRAGLEPATYGLEDRCSIQLSYRSQFWHCTRVRVSCPFLVDDLSLITGPVAQRLELTTHNRSVPGSNPGRPIRYEKSKQKYSCSTLWLFAPRHPDFACLYGHADVYLYDLGRQGGNWRARKLCEAIGLGNARSNSNATGRSRVDHSRYDKR